MLFAIVVADGVFASGFTLLHDTLSVAEVLRRTHDPAVPEIRVAIAGEQPIVRTGSGLAILTTARLDDLAGADVVVVPALGALDEPGVLDALDAPATIRMVTALADLGSGGLVAGACTGTFVLAEAGLLRGRRATTSWWLNSVFVRRYPDTELDADRMVVKDKDVLTAGAAFAHIDLALTLVRSVSVELADRVARHLLIDERATQSMYVPLDHVGRDDQLVRLFEQHVRANLAAPLPITTVARELATTPRTLERRVRAAANMTPLELIQRIRAERAEHLLATTEQSIDQIALDIGYRNGSTLRALLRKYRRKP
ncbi:transcriptional regulator GlxA family with amidase domain [Solirubrobacter pauli]|uniref:Transcriptional regulator GlxA family with amidase domain n=1 Tax=Solirubrobacter pauli TaxID=166793 RepID=A0A660L380_9ACTN|nr:helix-turn-helix domain-containing protein [Solirubrobacter pauli]RKQ88356.1 transcriptional regulator GlxA family with amidase domain [Solirubrobacter pauli]